MEPDISVRRTHGIQRSFVITKKKYFIKNKKKGTSNYGGLSQNSYKWRKNKPKKGGKNL